MHGGIELTKAERQYIALRGWFQAACYDVFRMREQVYRMQIRSRACNLKVLELEAEIARLKAALDRAK